MIVISSTCLSGEVALLSNSVSKNFDKSFDKIWSEGTPAVPCYRL